MGTKLTKAAPPRKETTMYNEATQLDPRPIIGGLEVTKVVREFEPIRGDDSGAPIPQFIDEYLRNAARNGVEIQTLALQFEREQWQALARAYQERDR